MVKRATFYLTLLLLAPCLSAQTAAGHANSLASSNSSSSDYDPTSYTSTPRAAASNEETELWARSYCAAHPDEDWTRNFGSTSETGHCPAADDKSVAVLNHFLAHHKKIAPSPINTQTLVAYVSYNKLNPHDAKSYERAYKSLKDTGQLELYR